MVGFIWESNSSILRYRKTFEISAIDFYKRYHYSNTAGKTALYQISGRSGGFQTDGEDVVGLEESID